MKCSKCDFDGHPNLIETGPHTKAMCPKCKAYIKMVGKDELATIIEDTPSEEDKVERAEKELRIYNSTSAMIAEAINAGFKHFGGTGLECTHCKRKTSVRKFVKDGHVVYACNKCGARY